MITNTLPATNKIQDATAMDKEALYSLLSKIE
jgi:hypothetical protein